MGDKLVYVVREEFVKGYFILSAFDSMTKAEKYMAELKDRGEALSWDVDELKIF